MSALMHGVFQRLLSRRVPLQQSAAELTDNRAEPRWQANGAGMLEWIDHEDSERAQAVHLVDESEGGVGVCSPIPLDAGWPVLLTLREGPPIKAIVRHRRRDDRGWVLGLQLIRHERRRFDRRPLNREIEVSWAGHDGSPRKAWGRAVDVGEGGLRFNCREPIPVRTAVMLAIEGWQRSGIIVHANSERELRSYGVQFSGPPVPRESSDLDQ